MGVIRSPKDSDRIYIFTILISFFLLWEILSRIVDTPFFPGVIEVLISVYGLFAMGSTFQQVVLSFFRVYESLLIALLISILLGILQHHYRLFYYLNRVIIYPILQSFPSISWVFLVAVWFGISHVSVIFIMCVILIPHILVNVTEGIDALDARLMEMATSFGPKRFKLFYHIMLPQLFPYIFSGFRRAHGVAWKVIVIAEMFAASAGIGFMMRVAARYYDVSRILALTGMILVLVIFLEYYVFERVKGSVYGYKDDKDKRAC